MASSTEVKHPETAVSTSKVKWKIENFCFSLQTDGYVVRSPEFMLRGINCSKWRLNLHVKIKGPNPARNSMSLRLERIAVPDVAPTMLSISLEVTMTASEHEYPPREGNYSNDQTSNIVLNFQKVKDPLKHFPPFATDTLNIFCFIIISRKDEVKPLSKPPEGGLKLLSEALMNLLEKKIMSDVTIKVNDEEIAAHKVILSRNKVFGNYLEASTDGMIHINALNFEAVSKFVTFLYSGNIDHILDDPSVSMIKCIEHFDSDILKCYFIPEEIEMTSKINADALDFDWAIREFLDESDVSIPSPVIKRLNTNTTWQLTLSMKSNRDDNSDGVISVNASIIEGQKPPLICLELAVKHVAGEIAAPMRKLSLNQNCNEILFDNFVTKQFLSPFVLDDIVCLILRIRTSDGAQESTIGSRTMSFVTLSEAPCYEKLSSDMAVSLKDRKYSDIVLKSGLKELKADKCVLAVRSSRLSVMIEAMSENQHTLTLDHINPDIFELMLEYIYSGVFKNLRNCDMPHVDRVFNKYGVTRIS